tara:strand:+ start:2099 stop:3394 length:1296 start_codon:yes stop_codon:yes gene_type:complete
MKIFLGLDDTCGYYTQLQIGLKSLGIPCTLVNAFPNKRYSAKHAPESIAGKIVERIGRKTIVVGRGSFLRYCWIAAKGLSLLFLLLTSLPRYDVFIFSGGTTFLNSLDLWLLKFFKKKVIVVYHGSESRAPYITPILLKKEGDFGLKECIKETRAIKKRLKKIEHYADIIINNPNASHLHENKFINWHCIGIPFNCPRSSKSKKINSFLNNQCVIVHAPTRPGPKGSPLIEKAIKSLIKEGHNIKFLKLTGKSNAEVLESIASCDFIVDELYSDVLMASLAGEAAMFGKPAIVGMYDYENIKASFPKKDMIPPVLACSPEDVKQAIQKLIVDKEFRVHLGIQAKEFIQKQWNSEEVAKRFLLLVKNEIPETWWFDPRNIRRLNGWGITEIKLKERLQDIINTYGPSALQLSHNPVLEQAFLHFSKSNQKSC